MKHSVGFEPTAYTRVAVWGLKPLDDGCKKAFYFKTIRDKVLLDLHKIKHNRNYAARCPLSYTSLPL